MTTMSLLLDIRDPSWMTEEALREQLQPMLPGVEIQCGESAAEDPGVTMLAAVRLFPGTVSRLPNLQLVQKLGAGVDGILGELVERPAVRVCRLKPEAPAREIAEYCIGYVLQRQRHVLVHLADQAAGQWRPQAPVRSTETSIGVLGLGHIGSRIAKSFAALDFRVLGWSRSARQLEGVETFRGEDGLGELLARSDYVISILPSTDLTRGLFDRRLLGQVKPGSMLINVGRGDLVVEDDLLDALTNGPLSAAVLDVFQTEPLPPAHPFWSHPAVTVTPHVSGWHIDGGLQDIAENYRRLVAGQPLLHEVNRKAGY